MSWTGTESRRREQGGVAVCPVTQPAFRIRTGSPCRYRAKGQVAFRPHTTFQTADFEDGEDYGSGYWLFQMGDYEYLIHSRFIDFA